MIQIAPSILSADFANLGETIQMLEAGGADVIHLDVMDGHFVPNISFGPPVVSSIRRVTTLPLDVHLMIENPDSYIQAFAEAGANWISVHVEACPHLDRTLQLIRSFGLKAGVVLNPATSLNCLDEVVRQADYVLLMSVNPGFGGQKFLSYVLDKIQRLRKVIEHKELSARIEVDGGVSFANLPKLIQSGAQILVVGSFIFADPEPISVVRRMKQLAEQYSIDPLPFA